MPGLAFADALHRLIVGYRTCGQTVVAENAQILREHAVNQSNPTIEAKIISV